MSEAKYDHVIVHAESSPELGGLELKLAGQDMNIIRMIAYIIANFAQQCGMTPPNAMALVALALPHEAHELTKHPMVDIGAIERAMEARDHE